MATEYDFSGLNETERWQIAQLLRDHREVNNGTDPRSQLVKVTNERDVALADADHWRKKYFRLKNGGQT